MKRKGAKKQVWSRKSGQKMKMVDCNFDGINWKIFNISLFGRDKDQVLNIIGEKIISGTKKYWIATVNPEFVMEAQKDDNFSRILRETNLNVVDGIGLIWAREMRLRKGNKLINGLGVGMEILRGRHRENLVTGADLVEDLVKLSVKRSWKMFLLGGFDDRAERAAKSLIDKFGLKKGQLAWCAGEPYVTNKRVIEKINDFEPDILLVAYGMKRQEEWIDKNLSNLKVGVVMGVGRSFDYYSGDLKRAPIWVRKMGLEWFYSLIREPKRIKRQLVLPKFVWQVLSR